MNLGQTELTELFERFASFSGKARRILRKVLHDMMPNCGLGGTSVSRPRVEAGVVEQDADLLLQRMIYHLLVLV